MTGPTRSRPVCVADVVDALDRAARERSEHSTSQPLVEMALHNLGFAALHIEAVQLMGLRRLYNQRILPLRLTLGAAAAIHIAQRSARLGLSDTELLSNVERVCGRILDVTPDRVTGFDREAR